MNNELTEFQTQKLAAIDLLKTRYEGKADTLKDIDPRLDEYFSDLIAHSNADPDSADDHHNVYELLGAAKFLRMLDTYNFNTKKVQTVIRLREGEWRREGRRWRHVSGGLKCPGTSGAQVYRWQPFQVFVLASVYGFYSWVDTRVSADERAELLPTERVKDGTVWDYRRVCTDFTYFGPRKTDKTGLAAYIQFEFFFFEDDNAEIYCCANSSDQAKLLYSRTRQLIMQMDQTGNRIRSTQTVTDWKQAFKTVHDSSVRPLSAGGKTKDGMFAQLCCADEYGSAAYTNGKSDMLSLVNVIQSSMGPRREPMTFTTTTAGTITQGPFMEKLDALHRTLERELNYTEADFESDRRLCLCLEPDQWERDEQTILDKPTLRKKVNPMLGLIVQHSSYDAWISEARGDQTKMPELLAKYFNIYQTGRMTKWITGDRIRPLQVQKRITDCHYQDGWRVFVGLDFSLGDDLYAMVALGVNYTPSDTMRGRFFADAVAWVLEKTMKESPNRPLYEEWVRQGWLYVCPGEVFDSMLSINQLGAIDDRQDIDIRFFGYDPAQSVQPINQLKAWLQTILQKKNPQATAADIANVIQQMVVPVSQTALTQNPRIAELESMILDKEPWIEFSMSPLWPWCFGNCAAEVSSSDLRRIVKGGPQPTHKIDLVHALLDALYGFDLAEGRVSE
jgi:phage terminase large subunit-like protein